MSSCHHHQLSQCASKTSHPRDTAIRAGGRLKREPINSLQRQNRVTTTLALALSAPIWNNLLHLLPERWRRSSAAIGVTVFASLSAAWLVVQEGADLLQGIRAALPYMALALATLILATIALRRLPGISRRISDPHIAAMTTREFLLYSTIRIPLATALAEELVFRGLVWFALESIAGPGFALGVSSALFGLWHIGVSARQAKELGVRVTGWILVTVLATTVAGVGFGWLRLITGGIWAPFIAHCFVNMIGAIAARIGSAQDAPATGLPSRGKTWAL